MKIDIVLAGVGGQGILSIATILGAAALKENLYIKQAEVHGMSQRGGDVQSNLRISSEPIASDLIPQGGADLIVSLEPMESLRYIPYLSKSGWIVTNTAPFINIPNYPEMETVNAALDACPNVVAFNMDDMAKEVASPRTSNMVLLGAAAPFLNIEIEKIEDGINTIFGAKGEAIVEMNIKAFRAGLEYTQNLLKSR
ncbi:MAG: indolepyruvate oxidoreductase subunit beta [Muribaculaceae bacterium]|jgi:indolepyruvate ferredoxin oxidoreductase beta subunit|nr:indolepyruvate oxidoreductase subunit beta [Muribaculaceae bacterium]MBO7165640.1 indolepyruvate oxidoreductase subunit beta [Muribaculaceae bacterium]MBQ1185300.1 indolepyruvate oxidoreductase subunit beta [Muribaculaceae bacterium]MBQ2370560.1 indolepyruvate oxidoreductase subunit beta [Muribaculaceae bacterium]MBQ2439975.1 indolepyruvate oxidoreductase subunit beta [Muribaculaceae bacterium]